MFQNLLADRFKLRFHREVRTMEIQALTVDTPRKMKRSDEGEPFDIPVGVRPDLFFAFWPGVRVPMAYLAWFVSKQLDRPVIDKTGLPGFYGFTLKFLPEPPPGAKISPPPDAEWANYPNIYQALKEQLGLKLEWQRGEVEFFVIDHVEKPTEDSAASSP
jgi:uncharacterized protein (TIGR03435 family)